MKRAKLVVPVVLGILAIGVGVALYAGSLQDSGSVPSAVRGGVAMAASPSETGDPYPLTTCPVTGEQLGSMGDSIIYDYEGREIRFCCKGCVGKFEADPEKYLAKMDAEIIAQQLPYYPTDTCVVSGEKLGGEMGEPIDYVHNNRLVRFCCKGCVKKFEADPATYMAKLN